jgi:hypothetical protein
MKLARSVDRAGRPAIGRGSADGGAAGELLSKGELGEDAGNKETIYCVR